MTAPIDDEEFERRILQNVREHGCQVSFIFDPEHAVPDFAYSIGLSPEVIIFGLNSDTSMNIVNDYKDMVVDTGLSIHDGALISGLVENFSLCARIVHPTQIVCEYFNSAMWFSQKHKNEKMQIAYQLVWPSETGVFPWEEGCAQWVIDDQLALWLPKVPA